MSPLDRTPEHHRHDEIFRLLVERVQDYAISVLDTEGRVTTWNEGARRIKGYSAAEILGRPFSIFYTPEDVRAQKPQNALRTALLTGRFEDEGERIRRDGSIFWANVVMTALRDEEQQVIGFAEITRVSERRPAQAELQARGEQLAEAQRIAKVGNRDQDIAANLLRSSEEAAVARFRMLADASESLAMQLDSSALIDTLAHVVMEALGEWCAVDLIAADGALVRGAVARSDAAAMTDPGLPATLWVGPPRRFTQAADWELAEQEPHFEAMKNAGVRDAIVCPLRASGETLGMVTVASWTRIYGPVDVAFAEELTRRGARALEHVRLVASVESINSELRLANQELGRQTEESQRARAAAEAANRTKAEFLASMSHELRTPLNAIAGYTQLLEVGVYGAVSEKQHEALERIQRNQRHLLGLVNDILNFVKLGAGRVRFDLTDVRVIDMLADLERLIELQVRARGLLYSWEEPDPMLYVRADRDRMDQVLLNLLSNAIKFTAAGGRIRVSCTSDESRVHIHVVDTGVGIPADKLELIFEPFVQIGGGTRRADTEGIGLGLAISRDLVRSMDGELTASSEVGRGSRFTLTLPRVLHAAPAARAVPENPLGSSGEDRGNLLRPLAGGGSARTDSGSDETEGTK